MASPSSKSSEKRITTFCRIRPTDERRLLEYQISNDGQDNAQSIEFQRPSEYFETRSSTVRKSQKYTFDSIFNENAGQIEIFEKVGLPVIENVLSGYNGTIFAYGQTATGKTYTIMGEELEYQDGDAWGLIPRAIDHIYEHLIVKDRQFEIWVSFLEIYREKMFDLLNVETYTDKKRTYQYKQEVFVRMDDEEVRLNNLSKKKVDSKEDALNVFLEGHNNRVVADTYANQASSRSHCVFTIDIEAEDDTGVLRSKLHLVDLAGSERVSKAKLGDHSLISEAKEINKSLLFLHKVIKAIAKKQKPETFRNTMITKILRDSLIGNSMTSLIATISIDEENIDETLSTCNFAESVSKIKTKPIRNKEEDLNLIIVRLQSENVKLTRRIKELENSTPTEDEELTIEETDDLRRQVLEYFNNDDPDSVLAISEMNVRIQFCFNELKILGRGSVSDPSSEVDIEVPVEDLTNEQKRSLDMRIDEFLAIQNAETVLEYENTNQAQYCFKRLKYIIKEFDDSKPAKKGCC